MTTAEKIQRLLPQLPLSRQAEVLDFVEFLLAKSEDQSIEDDWAALALTFAMRGMEDEETHLYNEADTLAA